MFKNMKILQFENSCQNHEAKLDGKIGIHSPLHAAAALCRFPLHRSLFPTPVFEISRGKLIISEVDNFEVLIILGVWADNLLIIMVVVDLIISQVDNYLLIIC